MNTRPSLAPANVLTAYFIITLALFLSNGYFSMLAFFLLSGGILLFFIRLKAFHVTDKSEILILRGALSLFMLLMLIKLNWLFFIYPVVMMKFRLLHVTFSAFSKFFIQTCMLALFACAALLPMLKPLNKSRRLFFFFMSFLYLAVMGIVLCLFSNPPIDIFDLFQKSGEGLRRGENPYSLLFPNMYYGTGMNTITHDPRYHKPVLDSMDYFPGIFPFLYINIWGDVRFLFLIFHFFSALFLFLLARGNEKGTLWALVHLYNPVNIYLLVYSFLDPLLVVSLCAATFCLARKKEALLPFALGYTLCVKQYGVFLLFAFLRNLSKRMIFTALTFSAVILGIAFLWSPDDFTHDALLRPLETLPRADALNLYTFLHHIGKAPSSWSGISFLAAVLFFLVPLKKENISHALFSTGVVYFLFFMFYRVTFFNYYCFALSFIPLSQSIHPASDFDT